MMIAKKDELPLEDLLSRAYSRSDECPPPEAFLSQELASREPADRERILRHAASCARCAAEAELARAFERDPSEDLSADDVEHVVERLASTRPQPAIASVKPFPGRDRSARRSHWLAPLAAAAVVVLVAAVVTRWAEEPAPELPRPTESTAMRGATISILGPRGDLPQRPRTLAWRPVPDAAAYRVELLAVDDSLLWGITYGESPATLPPARELDLRPRVRYRWRVEARDAEGRSLGRSELTAFRVVGPPSP